MAAIAREGDSINTGHSCHTTSTLKLESQKGNTSKVCANGKGISCLGDPVTSHNFPSVSNCVPCPDPVTESASSTVKIGGIGVCVVGDDVDSNAGMGSITGGSPDVNISGYSPNASP